MDIFGIGGPELIAILVIALLVLGPERMVDFARQAGKMWREAQLAVRGMADAATTKLDEERDAKQNTPPRDPVPTPEDAVSRSSSEEGAGGSTADEPAGATAPATADGEASGASAESNPAVEHNQAPRAS